MKITTKEDYLRLKEAHDAYEQAAQKWISENHNGIPTEVTKTFPFAGIVDNNLRSALEVYEFIDNPPVKYFLYIRESDSKAVTWMDEVLGEVSFGKEFRGSFGDKRQPVRIKAINGKTYSGTYYKSAGNYARVKQTKS